MSTVEAMRSRQRLREVIVRRPRVGTITGLVLALAFALVVTPIILAETWAVDPRVAPGEVAPVTVRVGADDVARVIGARRTGGVIIARGERATPVQAEAVAATVAGQPRGAAAFAAYALVLFVLAAGFTHHLKRSNRGRLLRVQLVLLGTLAIGALVTKGLLLAFPLSVLAVPVALGAIVPTFVHDRQIGLATGILAAVVMSLLVRFDVGVATVLVVQAVAAAIVIPERPRARWPWALVAAAVSTAGAALTYMAFAYLSSRALPLEELATPAASSFVAASIGGLMAAVLAMPLLPLYERACGEITHGKLVALEDLSHPLLRQIAEKAPGTWQHSLAMANLAEVAANSIGANGRLVRVGAYFHDLGKSLQPTYFIENLGSGEPSPHDQLAPEVSCDAIFSHVTEGILLARRHKLPERIIDFMHMHHGDGVLEYFWAKCRETGNPRNLTVADFRYPGVPPQSRETAILAVCDAVEAASRTLKRPDARSVENLVQRIVYGKLHLGQLDESGLSMSDLRRMSDSLREAIRHAHHDRIEYPWQREAAAEEAAQTAATVAGARPRAERYGLATQRLMSEPRLDSLDAPRPIEWDDRSREASAMLASAEPTPPSMTAPKKASGQAALGDTLDLAIATTAGLSGAAAASALAPAAEATSAAASGPALPRAATAPPVTPGGPYPWQVATPVEDAVTPPVASTAPPGVAAAAAPSVTPSVPAPLVTALPSASSASLPTVASHAAAPVTVPAPVAPPVPAPSVTPPAMAAVGPTADALADAIVAAEAPSESPRRPITLPPPMSTRLPAIPARPTPPGLTAAADPTTALALGPTAPMASVGGAAGPTAPMASVGPVLATGPAEIEDPDRRRAARETERLVMPSLEARAMRAVVAPPPTGAIPVVRDVEFDDVDTYVPRNELAAIPGVVVPAPDARPGDDDDAPEIELTLSADDAVISSEAALVRPATAPPPVSDHAITNPALRPPPVDVDVDASADGAAAPRKAPPVTAAVGPRPPPPPVTQSTAGSAWLGSLSARIDAMLDADDEVEELADAAEAALLGGASGSDQAVTGQHRAVDAPDGFEGDTVRRPPPAPPGRSRPIPRPTLPVDPEDVEASLELFPTVRPAQGGVFVGPPPATRVGRSSAGLAVPPHPPTHPHTPPAAPPAGARTADDDRDPEDRPTVVGPQPSGSMLPPRPRRGGPDHT